MTSAKPAALQILVDSLLDRHRHGVNAILFYGSCLRSGDLHEGVVDLYLIVDRYREFYTQRTQAVTNRVLPPNVFYIEVPDGEQVIRAKYAVLSDSDFRNGTSRRWFQTYIWGRFTQPVALAWSRDDIAREAVQRNLSRAATTFLDRVLPVLPATGYVRDLWERGLRLSYSTELRTEKAGRAAELTDAALGYYCEVSRAAASGLRHRLSIEDRGGRDYYHADIPASTRMAARAAWFLRRIQGKLLSVARLVKALFTFEGGLDYIAWKLERHSGQKIEVPDRVRRYPLIFVWGMFWKLYRRGVFR